MPDEVSIHEAALCLSDAIGAGTRIGPFSSVAANAIVGQNCTVAESATLGPGVALADGVSVGAGARLVANVQLGERVSVHENAVLGGQAPSAVGPSAVVGANVTVLPGVDVGRGAVLEAGAHVASTVPANAIVRGNPAIIVGYVGNDGIKPAESLHVSATPVAAATTETRVPGVRIHRLTHATDLRGSLVASDFSELPFTPRRVFAVLDVPSELVRGAHAHRCCEQFLVCLSGSVNCVVDDGTHRDEVRLDTPDLGLHLPAMIWGTQYKYTRDAVLLVLASDPYDAADYVRDYDEFLELIPGSP